MRKVAAMVFGLVISAALAACSGGDDDKTSKVAVTLREWEVDAQPAEVRPGVLVFDVTNSGSKQHQFLVVKSDLPPGQLPTLDVIVDEAKVNISGSVKSIQPGETMSVEIELFPGKYVLICNLIDRPAGGPGDPHYLNGMASPFFVLDE